MKDPNTTGKQRASRIPLDYYKTPDPVSSRKLFLTKLACLATLVWIFTLIPACAVPAAKKSPVGLERFSHGPVCKMHQSIGYECSACHVNFPMLGGREKEDSILAKGSRSSFSGDLKCLECHLGEKKDDKLDGYLAVHHGTQLVSMTPNCGTCHKDHKGLNQDLKRMADANCTNCHKDLGNAMNGTPHHAAAVSAFPDDHPDFRPVKEPDPSKIKFNHQYHMTQGIVLAKGGKPWTVADMKDGEQKSALISRLGSATAAVSLVCADCHKPEARDDRAWVGGVPPVASIEEKDASRKAFAERRAKRDWTPRGELEARHTPGAYMEPIKYDRNCASCHPLTIDARGTTVTHNQQPKELRVEVERLIGSSPPDSVPAAFFPLPGKKPIGGTMEKKERVDMVMRTLLEGKRTCGECHVSKDGSDLSSSTTEIARPDIPNVWFKHARFDHAIHDAKGIDCRTCHQQAYFKDEKAVQSAYAMIRKGAEQVMIPDIKNCQECHSPKPTENAIEKGWRAKHDCTECHNYHHGTPPRRGNQAVSNPKMLGN